MFIIPNVCVKFELLNCNLNSFKLLLNRRENIEANFLNFIFSSTSKLIIVLFSFSEFSHQDVLLY